MLDVEIKDAAAWLTINRPEKRNALSEKVVDAILEQLDRIETMNRVRAVCITGAGDKAFCSGADLGDMGKTGSSLNFPAKIAELLRKMANYPKPTVARVNGDCMAGGMGLMLACDMAYARQSARFATPEVKVGLFPMMIGALIFRNVSRKKALEMIYTGRVYNAAEAEEMGLITRVCPSDDLDACVTRTLSDIAAAGPKAIAMGRQTLRQVQYMDLDPALDYLCFQLGMVIQTEDASEGINAFMEKRKPDWKNR